MAPSIPARSTRKSTKKRTRQERAEDDDDGTEQQQQPQNEEDVDVQSPQAKKRNTAKTPSRATTAPPPSQQQDTPLTTAAHKTNRGRTSHPPTPSEEEASEEIDAEKEKEAVLAPHNNNNISTNGGLFFSLKSFNSLKKTTTNPEPLAGPTTRQKPKNDEETARDTPAEHPDEHVSPEPSTSNESFYRGRRIIWYSLLLCTFLSLICGVLWASVVTYDLTDYEMELRQCRRSLTAANRQLSASSSNAKDKFYLQELEKKAQHWKKQAKQHEAFAKGYKEEYLAILKQLEGE